MSTRKSRNGLAPDHLAVANRQSIMTLFSRDDCPHSHRVRFVLAEKNVNFEVARVEPGKIPEDLIDLNPYQTVPTLVDRELVLYDPRVIMEYLDERFPHPPLMPVDPVSRARARLSLFRVEQDWYELVDLIEGGTDKQADKARKMLRESVLSSADIFSAMPYFLSEEFSLVDCSVAPVLWRLPHYGISLPPKQGRPIEKYAERMFKRRSFRNSLTELELEMR
ncbi:MAG TPA: glutathione S-transferase N-terminal domain-containing protein [Gammaproteobacteria bacterium]|nr:glutathione S-transferase N-terminal domain-containing protein [Gammaproteobacteria bacterium]